MAGDNSGAPDKSGSKPFSIAIIGGGLGGIVLAIGLLKHGVHVHIYETAKEFGEVGAGIAFSPNSIYALGLTSPKLLEAFNRHATFNESPERESTWLTFRYGMDSQYDGSRKAGNVIFHMDGGKHGRYSRSCVHRARFLDEIVKLIPEGTASFSKCLWALEENDNGVRMNFRDGSTAWADAVIGCDGIKSKTREHLYGNSISPIYAGEYAYRALVPRKDYEVVMGHERTVNGQLYCGQSGYIITYPVEQGKSINMVHVSHKSGTTWDFETWLAPSTKEEMALELESWHPGLVSLLSKFGTSDKWALHSISHTKDYSRGRICLLGDSAHASLPHLGAGAGQAMEDAFVLSSLIGRAKKNVDLERVFAAYDAVRRPRSQKLVENSRLSGLCYAFLEDGIGEDAAKIESATSGRCHWLWDMDLENHLQDAFNLMDSAAS